MQQLIKITQQRGQQVVSARELHDYLGYDKSQWKRWYEKNILDNPFALENVDYQFFDTMSKNKKGRPTTDFAITIVFAKKMSMLARTEKGEQARNYFIACENESQIPQVPQLPQDYIGALEAYLVSLKEKDKLQKQITIQSAKIEFIDRVLATDENIDIGQCAKILELGFGRNILYKQLREQGVFFKNKNEPKQFYIDKGYFLLKEMCITANDGKSFMHLKILVTQRGLGFLSTKFKSVQKSKILIKTN
nr:phage antirepressor KilAC domain-containing protein [uncultured Flavobacterium sp.]